MRNLIFAIGLSIYFLACASAFVRPAAYGAELDLCVEAAKTKAESKKCREDVEKKYGRFDGGGDQ